MIKIRNLHKYYGSGENKLEVLKGLNLEIESGKIICLLGPSGSGKSTLLNILGGIESIDDGEVNVFGLELNKMMNSEIQLYRRNNVGFVFQFYNLINNLTVLENIKVGEYLSHNPLEIMPLIESLGLKNHYNKYPNEISGGQAQRTSIGRAMIKKPKLLICDEPTGALDYESAKEVLKLIENINKKYKTTIIIATHNIQISNMCDVVLSLHDGKIKSNILNESKSLAKDVCW